jgi:hypothetical protein
MSRILIRFVSVDCVTFAVFQSKCPFVDPSFPPAPKSLCYNKDLVPKKVLDQVVQWLRPGEIRTESGTERIPWTVYRTPLPSDISQGILGNCWLLSALAVVAENEDLVKHIVVTRDYCPEGLSVISVDTETTRSIAQAIQSLPQAEPTFIQRPLSSSGSVLIKF